MTKDELWAHLVEANELVTYKCLYSLLAPNPHRWGPHLIKEAVALASGGATITLGSLEVSLDSLMVHERDEKPGVGHYESHDYDEYQWTSAFRDWRVCRHFCQSA